MGKKDEIPVQYMKRLEAADSAEAGAEPVFRRVQALDRLEDGKSSGLANLYQQFLRGVAVDEKHKCLGYRPIVDGAAKEYTWFSYKEVSEMIKNLGSAMIEKGLVPENDDYGLKVSSGEHARLVGIYSRTRYEWTLAEYSCYYTNSAVVTLYDSLGPESSAYIFKLTHLNTCFVGGSNEIKNIINIRKEGGCPDLKTLIYFDAIDELLIKEAQELGLQLLFIHDLIKHGSTLSIPPTPCDYDDVCTVCFTSGTVAVPKGVILTHGNMISLNVSIQDHYNISFSPNDVLIGYLPLAHVFERFVEANALSNGACIGYYQGSMNSLVDDLKLLRPTAFISVPRLFNKIYNSINDSLKKKAAIKRWLFGHAYSAKIHNLRYNQATHFVYDKLIFKGVAAQVGLDRVRWFLSGSAPLADDISQFFKVVFSAPVMNGYGMTETCGGTCCSSDGDVFSIGSAGACVNCLELKLADVPEKNYYTKDTEEHLTKSDGTKETVKILGHGEICIRGPGLFKGYYKEDELTKQSFDKDGWFHTGDIGFIREDNGGLQIIDRIKNLFKLAQGEYIAVEKIENIYLLNSLVEQIFVYGNSYQSYIVAIVVPSKKGLFNLVSSAKLETVSAEASYEDLCSNEEVRKLVLDTINKTALENGLFGYERVRNIALEPVGWTPDNNILTPSLKLKRTVAQNKYENLIAEMYKEGQKI